MKTQAKPLRKTDLPHDADKRLLKYIKVGGRDECWTWTSCKSKQGYGSITMAMKNYRASRVVYAVFVGDIPTGLHILHSCDQPSCCNPKHLWLGTNSENVADKMEKKRFKPSCGEHNGMAKLTKEIAEKVRSLWRGGMRKCDIATRMGLEQWHVSNITNNQLWVDPFQRVGLVTKPRLSKAQVLEIRARSAIGEANVSLMKAFGLDNCTISRIIHRKTWKHI